MASTVVAVFDDQNDAARAQQDLIAAGVPAGSVRMTRSETLKARDESEPGFWDTLKDAFGFGSDEDRYGYAEAARRGGTVLTVDAADDASADRIATVLRKHNAVDLDAREAQWRQSGWKGYTAQSTDTTATAGAATARTAAGKAATAGRAQRVEGQETLPVVEEQLKVGKRAVQIGGVRLYSRVTETPVQEDVTLRQERVTVERHPVDRPLSNADGAFKEKGIEATQTREEAVVSKEARVVEEVGLRKDVEQQKQTVRDTVRRQDVEVEQLETDPRYAPAREFVTQFAADQRYRGRKWDEVEADARTSFEQRHPGKWNEYRDAIRAGYDRSRTKSNA